MKIFITLLFVFLIGLLLFLFSEISIILKVNKLSGEKTKFTLELLLFGGLIKKEIKPREKKKNKKENPAN